MGPYVLSMRYLAHPSALSILARPAPLCSFQSVAAHCVYVAAHGV
jgi:hypothetical protein